MIKHTQYNKTCDKTTTQTNSGHVKNPALPQTTYKFSLNYKEKDQVPVNHRKY